MLLSPPAVASDGNLHPFTGNRWKRARTSLNLWRSFTPSGTARHAEKCQHGWETWGFAWQKKVRWASNSRPTYCSSSSITCSTLYTLIYAVAAIVLHYRPHTTSADGRDANIWVFFECLHLLLTPYFFIALLGLSFLVSAPERIQRHNEYIFFTAVTSSASQFF